MSDIGVMESIQIGNTLRKLMEKADVDLKTLAEEVAVPYSTLHTWLQNGTPGDIMKLKRVADYFGVSLNYLVYGEQSTTKEVTASSSGETSVNLGNCKMIFQITVKTEK